MEQSKPRATSNVDPAILLEQKKAKSSDQFKATRITSCSQVLVRGGQAVAVGFPQKLTGYKAKNSYVNQRRSSELTSMSHEAFKSRYNNHCGMPGKQLERYHPDSYRSRMPEPSVVMPYKNSSQIQIGDRSTQYKRQYVTSYANSFKESSSDVISNQGIVCEKKKWQRYVEGQ